MTTLPALRPCGLHMVLPNHGLRLARQLLAEMEARDRFIAGDLLGDPIWRLLLDLYIRQAEGKATCVSSACIATRAPQTTALRLLRTMESLDLIRRAPDLADKRRIVVSLTRPATAAIEAYLAAIGAGRG